MLLLNGLPLLVGGLPGLGSVATPSFGKATIEALKTDTTTNGRQSVATLKVPGVDSLPANVIQSGSTVTVQAAASGTVLEDWDFRGWYLLVKGGADVAEISNCLFDCDPSAGTGSYNMLVELNAYVRLFEYNTVDGGDYGNAPVFLGAASTGSNNSGIEVIRRNRFVNLAQDVLKAAGTADDADCIVELNYFGPPKMWPNAKAAWSSGTTYQTGYVAMNGTGAQADSYVSLQDNNTNHALGDGSWWVARDWHADTVQWNRNNSCDYIFRWNYFDFHTTDYAHGLTGALFPDPIGTADGNDGGIYIYENIINVQQDSSIYNDNPTPIRLGNETNWGGLWIYNNWIQEDTDVSNSTEMVYGNAPATCYWGVNWELGDDSEIAYNDSRILGGTDSDMTDWSGSTPALGANWP